jgi:16S rRNA (adenine1518-N6/adenine1519-N6)-dimethyltransferase
MSAETAGDGKNADGSVEGAVDDESVDGAGIDNSTAHHVKVVANLPYYITTPIIMGLFEKNIPAESITVMVQKEVADRMNAEPGGKDYGALTLAVQYYSETYIAANVPPNCFIPRPNVGSAVIRLLRYPESPVSVSDDRWMFQLIKAAFGQRRKTLLNSLSSGAGVPKDATIKALQNMQLSETIRGEALTLAQFAELADQLMEYKN